ITPCASDAARQRLFLSAPFPLYHGHHRCWFVTLRARARSGMRYVWCTWLRASVFTETKRGGISLLSISNLHRSLRKREQICDRADRAIRANVRGRIYQVGRAENSNITAEYGRASSRTRAALLLISNRTSHTGRSGMSHGDRLCSVHASS